MQPPAALGRSDIRNYFLSNPEARPTHVLISAPNILQYGLDSLTQEQYLSRGSEVALVVRQPFCFCWQKITRLQFQEFAPFFWPQYHLSHLPSNYTAEPHFLPLNLLSLTSCICSTKPWFWAFVHRIHKEYYLLAQPAILLCSHTLPVKTAMAASMFPPISTCCLSGNYFPYIILQSHMFTVFNTFPRVVLLLETEHALGSWINTA